jgi:oligopeptide transport system substrate-binding protein
MKRLMAVLLVVVLVFGLAACQKTQDPVEGSSAIEASDGDGEGDENTDPQEVRTITAKELMKNANARKAMALAFDKSYIADVILNNGSIAANYFVPAGLAKDDNGVDFRAKYEDGFLNFSPEEASKYWQMAKDELNFDTVEVEFLTYDSEVSKKISEFIQGQLHENLEGISVVLNQQPFKNKLELSDAGEFEFEYAGWGPDYPDPMTFLDLFLTGAGHNTAGYSSEAFDDAVLRSKVGDLAGKPQERWEALQEAERLLVEEDAVVVPIFQRGTSSLQSPVISGVISHAFGGDFTYKYAQTTLETDGKRIYRLLDTSDIPSMDTNKATNSVSFEVMANVLEGLVMLGENDVPELGVASSYEMSEDGLVYTFNLREDAVWSNGEKVTAHDFVYSWRRLADPNTASQYQSMTETAQLKNYAAVMAGELPTTELGVVALDDYTLQATLEIPVPFFIKLMTFPNFYPVNEAFVTEVGDAFGTSVETTLYNGPFELTNWEIGYGYAFMKNDMYHSADSVMLDGVTYRIIKDTAAGVNLYDTGDVDRAGLSGEFVEQYIDHPHFVVDSDVTLFYLIFNINNTGMTEE